MNIASIDVGIVNLAIVAATVSADYKTVKVDFAQRINLLTLPHHHISRKQCQLPHTRSATDLISHFIQEYKTILNTADAILIERQPLTGLVHIEQLLFHCFRKKAHLCSPNSMHRHFGLPANDYDGRKIKTVEIAKPYLQHLNTWIETDRMHDMADAVCMLLFWIHAKQVQFEENEKRNQTCPGLLNGQSVTEFLNQFRYSRSDSEMCKIRTRESFFSPSCSSSDNTDTPPAKLLTPQ